MTIFDSIILGILQGFTEFLPVSSSGHLVIAEKILVGVQEPGILFDTLLHIGSLLAVIVYFRKKLLSYINFNFIKLMIIGTIPAVIVGLFFKDFIEGLFTSTKVVGVGLIITSIFNFLTDRKVTNKDKILPKKALITGIAQAFAITPGISRSGTTIFASVYQGIKKEVSAEFSFMLSIPAILGASLLELVTKDVNYSINWFVYGMGMLFAFLSGLLAIYLVFKVIQTKKFRYFGIYCLILGILTLIFI